MMSLHFVNCNRVNTSILMHGLATMILSLKDVRMWTPIVGTLIQWHIQMDWATFRFTMGMIQTHVCINVEEPSANHAKLQSIGDHLNGHDAAKQLQRGRRRCRS